MMSNKNDTIGKWSLNGTLIGIVLIGIFLSIGENGFKGFFHDSSKFVFMLLLGVIAFFIVIFIINLFPKNWEPFISITVLSAFLFVLYRSWIFTVDRKSTRLNSSHVAISYAV